MNRGTGSGLLGLGVVLIVAGAIMRYAVEADPSGFDVFTAGGILLVIGVISALVGLVLVIFGGRRSITEREEISSTPHGQQRTVEQEGWSNP
jgi:hypothetical protein